MAPQETTTFTEAERTTTVQEMEATTTTEEPKTTGAVNVDATPALGELLRVNVDKMLLFSLPGHSIICEEQDIVSHGAFHSRCQRHKLAAMCATVLLY